MFYIEYKDKQSGKTYQRYFPYKPTNVMNAYCPRCGNQVMDRQVIVEPIVETHVYYECLHCGQSYEEYDVDFVKVNSVYLDPIVYLEAHEINDEVKAHVTYITNDNVSDTMHGIQDIEKMTVVNAVTLEEAIITPQSRNVRYTPEFLEKAAKAMRDIPLARKNIRIRDIEMHSQCPACGGMLYEEANIIFNYCPWCAQALDNNDFSEDEKVED